MPSHIADAPEFFRAVIFVEYEGGSVGTQDIVLGPYLTRSAAKAAITRETRDIERRSRWQPTRSIEARIDRGVVSWEPVE